MHAYRHYKAVTPSSIQIIFPYCQNCCIFCVAAEEDSQIEMSCIFGLPAMFQMLN